jgi:hypothetical protein
MFHHHHASLLSTLYEFMQKYPQNGAGLSDTYVEAKARKFVGFTAKNTGI